MLMLRGTHDRIDWTRPDALRAADARVVVDACHAPGRYLAAGGIERDLRSLEQARKRLDGGQATGGATVDRCGSGSNRFGVGPAPVVAAAAALGLGEQAIDLLYPLRKRRQLNLLCV
jgi:hypothetical protein